MRLEPEEIVAIKAAARRTFGNDVHVYLYGSRVDDSKRGGDIDLLFEVAADQATVDQENKLRADLESMLGERRIDILLHARHTALTPIVELAYSTGVPLL